MKRVTQLIVVAALAALLSPAVASSAPRMYVGFHDDVAFRWNDNRAEVLDEARGANATIVRTLVDWSKTAPTRPADAANPLDPGYRFADIDELVRNAQQRGLEVIITIWGTPKWANAGKTPNNVPTRVSDLQNFSRAVAARYSGRYAQYPFVGRYSVWNESNLQLFLSPQFDAQGRSVGPRLYAKMYAAAYAGIKAGNSSAQVAIGSTSSHGRDKKLNGKSDTHSPGRFAQLVAAANSRLKFSAWAHHPYPTPQYLKPTQKVKWPNVTLSSLTRFEQSLDTWFKRKGVRIWITEYGHETKQDGEPNGVSRAQQASYAAQAIGLAKKDPRVDMFVWFIFRDDETSVWQSGLLTKSGAAKPALASFRNAAKSVDARNPLLRVSGGIVAPAVAVPLRELAANLRSGDTIGINFRVYLRGKMVATGQPATTLGPDAIARFRLVGFRPAKKTTYVVRLEANTANGGLASRELTIVAS
ncbi:MAG: cellulase family glycosylhydrolase [Gaiellaceae bacterium]